jgi:hypothetical protein
MPRAGFEPETPATKEPQTYALDRAAPGERNPGTHCTGGWLGPRAGLDTEARGKILCPCRGTNPDRPVVQSVARHYTA